MAEEKNTKDEQEPFLSGVLKHLYIANPKKMYGTRSKPKNSYLKYVILFFVTFIVVLAIIWQPAADYITFKRAKPDMVKLAQLRV